MRTGRKPEPHVKIDRERFKKILKARHVLQKEIAEMLGDREDQFSALLRTGYINKIRFDAICDYLDISRAYLSGKSDDAITRKTERLNELRKEDPRTALNFFVACFGYPGGYCDDLTDTQLISILKDITFAVEHEDEMDQDYGKISPGEWLEKWDQLQVLSSGKFMQIVIDQKIEDQKLKNMLTATGTERGDAKKPDAAKKQSKSKLSNNSKKGEKKHETH